MRESAEQKIRDTEKSSISLDWLGRSQFLLWPSSAPISPWWNSSQCMSGSCQTAPEFMVDHRYEDKLICSYYVPDLRSTSSGIMDSFMSVRHLSENGNLNEAPPLPSTRLRAPIRTSFRTCIALLVLLTIRTIASEHAVPAFSHTTLIPD